MEKWGKGVAEPEKTLGVGQRRQDGGSQQLVPMLGDDGHGHHEHAERSVCNHLGQGSPQQRRRKGVYDLPVGRSAHGALAGGSIEDRQGIDRLGARLLKVVQTRATRALDSEAKGVHSDAATSCRGHSLD